MYVEAIIMDLGITSFAVICNMYQALWKKKMLRETDTLGLENNLDFQIIFSFEKASIMTMFTQALCSEWSG